MTVSNRVIFPAKNVSEILLLTFEFLSRLSITNEIVDSAIVTASVWSGNDQSPANILSGLPDVVGVSTVTQLVTGGVLGTTYVLNCIAITSSGQKLALNGYLSILPDTP